MPAKLLICYKKNKKMSFKTNVRCAMNVEIIFIEIKLKKM